MAAREASLQRREAYKAALTSLRASYNKLCQESCTRRTMWKVKNLRGTPYRASYRRGMVHNGRILQWEPLMAAREAAESRTKQR